VATTTTGMRASWKLLGSGWLVDRYVTAVTLLRHFRR
jgi:hypothetical protein